MNDDDDDDVGTDSEARDHVPPVADPPSPTTRRPAQAYVNGLNAASEQMEAAQAKGAPFSEIVMNPLDHPLWIFPPRGGAPDFSLTLFLRSFSNPSTRTHARAVQETWSPWRG